MEENIEVEGARANSPVNLENQEDEIEICCEEYPDHALFNSLILNSVLGHCDPSFWQDFRLVCKTWNAIVLHRYREQRPVHLSDLKYVDSDDEVLKNRFTALSLSVHDPDDPLQFDTYPFRRIVFHPNTVVRNVDPPQNRFWNRAGPWLKGICLNQVFISPTMFKQLLLELTPNLEQLKYIECKLQDYSNQMDEDETLVMDKLQTNLKSVYICMPPGRDTGAKSFPMSWLAFFSHIPNLKSLKLEGFHESTALKTLGTITDTIINVRESNGPHVLNLTELKLRKFIRGNASTMAATFFLGMDTPQRAAVTAQTLPKIMKISRSLHTLSLHINALNGHQLSRLLGACPNLINLKLGQQPTALPLKNFRYSSIPRTLENLEIKGSVVYSWEFLNFTPNLKRLTLFLTAPEAWTQLTDECVGIPPIESMKTFQYWTRCDIAEVDGVETIEFLAQLMPNLETVAFQADDDVFEAMLAGWPRIRNFSMRMERTNPDLIVARLPSMECLEAFQAVDNDSLTEENLGFTVNNLQAFLTMPKLRKLGVVFYQDEEEEYRRLSRRVKDTSACFIKIWVGVQPETGEEFFTRIPMDKYMEMIDVQHMTGEEIQTSEMVRIRLQLDIM